MGYIPDLKDFKDSYNLMVPVESSSLLVSAFAAAGAAPDADGDAPPDETSDAEADTPRDDAAASFFFLAETLADFAGRSKTSQDGSKPAKIWLQSAVSSAPRSRSAGLF